MITLSNLTLRRGTRILLENVNWTIYHKQHIGIIGANGSGKSSLFAMLLNQLQPDAGDLQLSPKLRLAHVAQETPGYEKSALDFVLDGDAELRTLEEQLRMAEEKNNGHLIASLHEELACIDAYTAKTRAAQLLSGLGFNDEAQQKSVRVFSGGWRMRLNLAQALMCRSDILLLDEPTNHLDLDAVIWLEQYLKNYPGTLLLISHDREFLDETVDHIAHIANENLKQYTGNYSTFEKSRAADILQQQSQYEKQQRQLAHLQSFVDRFRAKATKARQAQSRLKAIDRLELVNAVQLESPFQFHFQKPDQCPNPLIRLEHARVQYGDNVVLSDISLTIGPKDRIAMLGPNGAGKTSLIKLLAGDIETATGVREASSGLKIGYFAQHQVDHLKMDATALDHLKDLAPQQFERDLRTYLGTFGFVGDEVNQPIRIFSGGEKSRLALALLIWQKPNLLLLDEPTNHLDLEMRQALSIALQEYEGAMLIVSHDRFLVRTTADQLMLVANQKMQDFTGDLSDYEKWLLDFRREQTPQPKNEGVSKKQLRQQNVKDRASAVPVKKLEDKLAQLQKKLVELETILANQSLYEPQNKETLKKHLLEQTHLAKEIATTEEEWLKAHE